MAEGKQGRTVTEGQLLLEFMTEEPEYVRATAKRVIERFVEARIGERRAEFTDIIDSAIKQAMIRVAADESLQAYAKLQQAVGEKPLAEEFRAAAQEGLTKTLQLLLGEMARMKVNLRELREAVEGDSEWWRNGGEPPGGDD
ncbi:hypothetical protein NG895_02430 [Aeoliella sp. ICT_H6.2]|uniref:Uncharacterized protein n=1 Tax=Aeoliella straminimaris TaxID=2954799 RepID=A0A9X2FAK7_9BACT|nr:hypothetical protein [Aeoliella straminimaris]MCO6042754.1 hypothetical protein [Aeoliella straminimaris]